MNGRMVTFLATMVSSTLGMLLFVIIIATSAIKGWGTFGSSREWENSRYDDDLVEEENAKEREKYPELYKTEDLDVDQYYKGEDDGY